MRHKVVVVTWDDAFVDTDDFTIKAAEKTKGVRRHTVGWLVAENDDGIVMATDYYEKDKKTFNTRMFIDWNWVVEYVELEYK